MDSLNLTTQIVAAYVTHNSIRAEDLPNLIKTVDGAVRGLSGGATAAAINPQTPAVPIKKSVTPEYLVCLEDGKKLKMLKRYLRSNFDMSPEQYRVKWGLTRDYPMVAPDYARLRSEFAKKIGLGKTPGAARGRRR